MAPVVTEEPLPISSEMLGGGSFPYGHWGQREDGVKGVGLAAQMDRLIRRDLEEGKAGQADGCGYSRQEARKMKVTWLGREAGGLSPALSALFNVLLVRVCGRSGAEKLGLTFPRPQEVWLW